MLQVGWNPVQTIKICTVKMKQLCHLITAVFKYSAGKGKKMAVKDGQNIFHSSIIIHLKNDVGETWKFVKCLSWTPNSSVLFLPKRCKQVYENALKMNYLSVTT